MITRNEIIEELLKHGDKDRNFKRQKVVELIASETEESKTKILSDLESYNEY